MSAKNYRKGQRYQVAHAFESHVLTMWKAPFTGGYRKTIPVGLRFAIICEPPATATAVTADVEQPSDWESILVDKKDINDPKYNGFYLVIPFDLVENHCIRAD